MIFNYFLLICLYIFFNHLYLLNLLLFNYLMIIIHFLFMEIAFKCKLEI